MANRTIGLPLFILRIVSRFSYLERQLMVLLLEFSNLSVSVTVGTQLWTAAMQSVTAAIWDWRMSEALLLLWRLRGVFVPTFFPAMLSSFHVLTPCSQGDRRLRRVGCLVQQDMAQRLWPLIGRCVSVA